MAVRRQTDQVKPAPDLCVRVCDCVSGVSICVFIFIKVDVLCRSPCVLKD